jgi:hypothetical protein
MVNFFVRTKIALFVILFFSLSSSVFARFEFLLNGDKLTFRVVALSDSDVPDLKDLVEQYVGFPIKNYSKDFLVCKISAISNEPDNDILLYSINDFSNCDNAELFSLGKFYNCGMNQLILRFYKTKALVLLSDWANSYYKTDMKFPQRAIEHIANYFHNVENNDCFFDIDILTNAFTVGYSPKMFIGTFGEAIENLLGCNFPCRLKSGKERFIVTRLIKADDLNRFMQENNTKIIYIPKPAYSNSFFLQH